MHLNLNEKYIFFMIKIVDNFFFINFFLTARRSFTRTNNEKKY